MLDKDENLEEVFFECDQCRAAFTLGSFLSAVDLYGVVFLVGKSAGYFGIVCPKCLTTTLKKTHEKDIESLRSRLLFEASSNEPRLVYHSFPYSLDYHRDNIPNPIGSYMKPLREGSDSLGKSEVDHLFSKDSSGLSEGYCTYFFGDLAVGPAIAVWWFKEENIHDLIIIENDTGLKIFPRYMLYNPLHTAINSFCWKYYLESDFIKGLDLSAFPVMIMKEVETGSSYRGITRNSDFLNILATTQTKDVHNHKKMINELRENFNTKHTQKILSTLPREFMEDYSELAQKIHYSSASIENLKQEFLEQLHGKGISFDLKRDMKVLAPLSSWLRRKISVPQERHYVAGKKRPSANKAIKIRRDYDEQIPEKLSNLEEKFPDLEKIITKNRHLMELKYKVAEVAKFDTDMLIVGETGTGKELFAQAIHQASERKGNFVPINCGSIPKDLFESELFGHKRGSFTGAISDKMGAFEYAQHGTLFLDELGEMPIELQPKLLRAIEYKEVKPVGSGKSINVDAKLVFASNRDLNKEVEFGNFRKDLFFRIFSPSFRINPLRERAEDIALLADHFRKHFNRKFNKQVKSISPNVIKKLKDHPWEGNVRELMKGIEMAVINSNGSVITENELPDFLKKEENGRESKINGDLPSATKITDDEIRYWMKKLNNNKSQVAEKLGVTYRTILRRCKNLNL